MEKEKPVFRDLFDRVAMSNNQFAIRAGVSSYTIASALKGNPLKIASVRKITKALNEILGTDYKVGEIEGLTVALWRHEEDQVAAASM